ncbi:hypothetical protein GCM10025862_16980 [Arsenicicoccus piscis]|uniref:Uncharacterized protein n=1 Tax=Arsenicicoccus piscis TaxID=673954 RepID=A0ABQ6HMX2_9MICO|nr:hypothetical protein GCM10025862_16980 [Arsenicicoccus piscis]
MVAHELQPPVGGALQEPVDDSDDLLGVRAAVDQVTHLHHDEVVREPTRARVTAQSLDLRPEVVGVPTHVPDHRVAHQCGSGNVHSEASTNCATLAIRR